MASSATALAVIALLAAGHAKAGPSPEVCKAAVVALHDPLHLRDIALYSPEPPGREALFGHRGVDFTSQWDGQPPEPALLARLDQAVQRSAMECPEFRAAAAQDGEIVTAEQARAQVTTTGLNGVTLMWRRFSLPVLSRDGRRALVLVLGSSNQHAGGMVLLHLARGGQGWAVVGRKPVILV